MKGGAVPNAALGVASSFVPNRRVCLLLNLTSSGCAFRQQTLIPQMSLIEPCFGTAPLCSGLRVCAARAGVRGRTCGESEAKS